MAIAGIGLPTQRLTTPIAGVGLPPGTTSPTSGDPNTTDVGGFGGIIAGILDLINGARGQGGHEGATAAALADPFAAQRGGYQKQLLGLMTDPSTFQMDPGAIFARDEGLQGVARAGNAMFGTTRSGNTAVELERYATGFGEQAYNKRIDQLMAMAGVNTGSPAAAADAYLKGNQINDQDLGSGLHSIDSILNLLSRSGIGGAAMDAIKSALGLGPSTPHVNPDGTINYGTTVGQGDQGGFVGDETPYVPDPSTVPIDFGPDIGGVPELPPDFFNPIAGP